MKSEIGAPTQVEQSSENLNRFHASRLILTLYTDFTKKYQKILKNTCNILDQLMQQKLSLFEKLKKTILLSLENVSDNFLVENSYHKPLISGSRYADSFQSSKSKFSAETRQR